MSDGATAVARPRPGVRAWPLYVGGFLGPYASTMVTPMVHEVAVGLRTTPEVAAAAVTTYMFPFAAVMLVSGTLAERWGRARTMQLSLIAFVVACACCVLAPTIEWFLAARALQGVTNAFTTPLLVAAITDLVPRAGLGRALGFFAGMQAAGQAASPLVSGPSAVLDWRLAFAFPALVAVVLAVLPPTMTAGPRPTGPPPVRALLNRNLALACALSFLCYFAAVGLTVLAILRAEEDFGLGPWQRGVLAAGFGVAGLLAAPLLGRRLDALGPWRTGVLMNLLLAVGLVVAALGPSVLLLGLGVAAVGVAVTGLRTTVNAIAATSTDGNRAGAASLALSFQFFGGALAPLVWVPLHAAAGGLGFAATALAPLVGVGLAAREWLSRSGPR
ncbi:MFS transporter [Pseudonocardia sp. EC080610-09]|uniref:MFS transporter n=1 Tax=unclassified Pseudonocardia TaxID=2619320 RepID=UPI0006CB2E4C|nr:MULTISPECIES: MFS transporter [unclassified Pseudonocardia]ALE72864.1 MFS transporter [Pseudonocardia sp. EC080625-04]ALL76187.1 MFS transporter [Pseudonocardia sp. EC080610-09]ALL83212.1 MFS transporter [Pseudonocardia sp. EC080619-01]